jgi:hypothetical protein
MYRTHAITVMDLQEHYFSPSWANISVSKGLWAKQLSKPNEKNTIQCLDCGFRFGLDTYATVILLPMGSERQSSGPQPLPLPTKLFRFVFHTFQFTSHNTVRSTSLPCQQIAAPNIRDLFVNRIQL